MWLLDKYHWDPSVWIRVHYCSRLWRAIACPFSFSLGHPSLVFVLKGVLTLLHLFLLIFWKEVSFLPCPSHSHNHHKKYLHFQKRLLYCLFSCSLVLSLFLNLFWLPCQDLSTWDPQSLFLWSFPVVCSFMLSVLFLVYVEVVVQAYQF